jgi:uncharacterized membrane protein
MLEFVGHFHPVLVHLPIGILLMAILLQWMARKKAYTGLQQAVRIALAVGVLAAIASCITGYLLSLSGDYDSNLVDTHMWLAITLTVVSAILFWREVRYPLAVMNRALSLVVVVLLLVAGHLGGSLTHGPGYLTVGLGSNDKALTPILRPVADIPSAAIYADLVQPVLHDNCYRCHSAVKQKGGLRLDGPEMILKGGKNGKLVIPGQASGSELIKRVLLPYDDEHHMAPKGKPQLSADEIALLTWWVNTGASFDKKVDQLARDSMIAQVLTDFHEGKAGPLARGNGGALAASGDEDRGPRNVADSDMPREPVSPASPKVVAELQAAGVLVLPIAQNSAYVEVSFLNDSLVTPATLQSLSALKQQLVSLKGSHSSLDDRALPVIGQCTRLVRLWLDHTAITGKALGSLQSLTRLRYLNLSGTAVTTADLLPLGSLPQLATLYVFRTGIDKRDWKELQRSFPHTRIDSGGYLVPLFATDTTIVKPPAAAKAPR